ncbi:hypothetical protein DACRYDRAFT_23864 [Dacryopinax primogenitus]|uniref:J domain-containing protein n=1 Tax=Dacryopinax primogenitus (strain DJM 731) TaxID=1858805 RepID=M5FTA2_DACPD|nr:uncharacterized protein DACRYDRAFT_23864 [Dacryopinax primogenitus]EJT99253.1 hypothetical protein DACRYDRAFT_23864 [Dacryopinax primogenitus]
MDWDEREDEDYDNVEEHVYGQETGEVEEEVDYYALLNVEKTASTREIHQSYRHLASLLHPDKHPPKHREMAEKRFQDLTTAYTVLTDENKRHVYDTLGVRGLKFNWAVTQPRRPAEELRQDFEHFNNGMRWQQAQASITNLVALDARGIFQQYVVVSAFPAVHESEDADHGEDEHEEAVEPEETPEDSAPEETPKSDEEVKPAKIKLDVTEKPKETKEQEIELEVIEPPLLSLSRLQLSHSTTFPLAKRLSIRLLATAGTRDDRGTANFMGTAKYQFPNGLTAEVGSNLIRNRVPFAHAAFELPYLKQTRMTVRATCPTLLFPPPISLSFSRRLSSRWESSLALSTGTWVLPFWPPDQTKYALDLDESKENVRIVNMEDDPELEPGWKRMLLSRAASLALKFGVKQRPRTLSLTFTKINKETGSVDQASTLYAVLLEESNPHLQASWGGTIPARRLIYTGLAKLLPGETEAKVSDESKHANTLAPNKIAWNFMVDLGLLTGIMTVTTVSGQTGPASWGVSVDLGESGVWLRIKVGVRGQKITVPIWLIDEPDLLFGLSTVGVVATTVLSCFTASELWHLLDKRRRLKALREARAGQLAKKRQEAEGVHQMLKELVERSLASKQTTDGLAVLAASYGPAGAFDPATESAVPSPIDVTLPIQALMSEGHLHIAGGRSKSGLLGFYDAFPDLKKALRITYQYEGKKHEVTVGDLEEVSAPSEAHLIPE